MSTFKRNGPVYLKTYGKHKKKVETWVSPDIRKKAFSSSSSSDLSINLINSSSLLSQRKKATRASKKRALTNLKEKDSDEENIVQPNSEPCQNEKKRRDLLATTKPKQMKTKRKKLLVLSTSESEDDSRGNSIETGQRKTSVRRSGKNVKPDNSPQMLADLGRFVTNRRKHNEKQKSTCRRKVQRNKNVYIFDSSEDFVRPHVPRQSVAKRKQVYKTELFLEDTGSDIEGILSNHSKTRRHLQETSLNRTSDRILTTSYKRPLLSSTPSVPCKPSFRHYEPSISEISFSNDEAEDVFKSSVESGRNTIFTKSHELRVLVASNLELQKKATEQLFLSKRSGEQSESKRNGTAAENTKELFPHIGCDTTAANKDGTKESCLLSSKDVYIELSRNSNSLSAETHLDSLVTALKQKCKTSKPVVCLQRSSISCTPVDQSSKNQKEYLSITDCDMISNCGQSKGNFSTKDIGSAYPGSTSNASQSTKNDEQICKRLEERSAFEDLEKDIITTDLLLQYEAECAKVDPLEATVSGATQQSDAQSRDLVSVMSQMENFGPSDQHDASLKDFSDASCGSSQKASVEADLKAKCISVQPFISLKRLDLSKYRVGGRTPVPERDGIKPGEHRRSGGTHCAIRRRLSALFAAGTSSSSSEISSPARKRTTCGLRVPDPPKDKPVTGRKACVSGLSMSRWTRKDGQQRKKSLVGSFIGKISDSSMFDFQLGFDNKKKSATMNSFLGGADVQFATPSYKEPMNVSSFLANFGREYMTTHSWGKLKAALSVHKKKKAFITPRKLHLSQIQSPEVGVMDTSNELPAFSQCTPFSQHLMARLPTSTEGASLGLWSYAEDITDAEKVYHECQQEGPITFEQCIPLEKMKHCKKIGEGTFGEVFSTVSDSMETVALKIIPIEGGQKVNGEEQKTFGEILQEIISSKELSSLGTRDNNRSQGFIGLNDLHCVQGSYPDLLLAAWDKFDKQRVSENDRPGNQLFLILEFEFGGCDLENLNCKLSSLVQAQSILHQVTAALAVAEQALCFEHRDLHWGNILVKETTEKKGTYVLNGIPHTFETKGVLVNIIDYSLSRLEIDGLTVFCDIAANEELFMGQGDYQFDIYRKMREENNNSWSEYNPHTNVLWLHYLADKLLHMNYKNKNKNLSKPMKVLKENLIKFYNEVLELKSASSVLEGSSLFK